MLAFLRRKFSGYTFGALVRTQFESFAFLLFSGAPTFAGMALRALVCRVLFKKLAGFIWLQARVEVVNANRIQCGKNVAINSGTYLNGLGGITMGDHVLVGSNVTISSGMHPIGKSGGHVFEKPAIPKPIVIETGVWIGAGAVIMPGVTLGEGCVIGANAVVTKSTLPYSINVGVPARFVRFRPEES